MGVASFLKPHCTAQKVDTMKTIKIPTEGINNLRTLLILTKHESKTDN